MLSGASPCAPAASAPNPPNKGSASPSQVAQDGSAVGLSLDGRTGPSRPSPLLCCWGPREASGQMPPYFRGAPEPRGQPTGGWRSAGGLCLEKRGPRATSFPGGAWLCSPGPQFTWGAPAGARCQGRGPGAATVPCGGVVLCLPPHLAESGAPSDLPGGGTCAAPTSAELDAGPWPSCLQFPQEALTKCSPLAGVPPEPSVPCALGSVGS